VRASPRALVSSFALAAAVAEPQTAHAQPEPAPDPPSTAPPAGLPPPAPVLVPPRPEVVPDPPYPAGAHGDATVVLRLDVEKDGSIGKVVIEQGAEPFASAAATAAASTWRFSPATRDGVPMPARIRFEVRFTEVLTPVETPEEQPELAPEPATPGAAPAPGTPAAPPPPAAIDVDVRGLKLPPSVTSLTRAEVRQLPGAFGDPFRAIEVLPGVTPIVSGLPFFYVRGAPPGNVGYFLDGVRVPYLFHVAAGPSVVHPAIIERVDLYSGGYPARYGRYAGAIVSAETTEPRADLHGEGVIRLVDAGAMMEAGFDDGRGTALAAGRYSYTGALFSLISPEITLDYRDFQARATYDVTDRERVSLFAFGAYDYLSETTLDIETVLFGSEFYRLDGRYDVRLPQGGKMRAAATLGFDRTRIADGRNTQDVLVGSRFELAQPIDDQLTVRGGFDVQHDLYSVEEQRYVDPDDPDGAGFAALFPPRADGAVGAWADVVWQLDPRLEVTPGLRLDGYFSGGASALAVDPRLALRVEITRELRLLHALGLAHQPPAFVVPVPGLAVAELQGGLQKSLQTSAGIEVDLPWSSTASVTVFDSVFLDMSDTLGVRQGGDPSSQLPRSDGGAKGVEVYIRRSLARRVGGFVSYTFSRTTRTIDGITIPAAFDRTHVLHSAVGYDLGRGWRAGTRFSLYSGPPRLQTPDATGYRPDDPPRDAAFYRLDFRVEKKWTIAQRGWISFVIEMLNATLNTETIQGQEVGPVTIPSLGVEGGF
jgi:TonB family protein